MEDVIIFQCSPVSVIMIPSAYKETANLRIIFKMLMLIFYVSIHRHIEDP